MADPSLTLVGNLVADPELRYTASGVAVAGFRVAATPRVRNKSTGEYEDGETVFMRCSIWREAAEHVAESLKRGMRVVVSGRLQSKPWTNDAGEKRDSLELDVWEVGPSLRYATATVHKAERAGAGAAADDPWAVPTPAKLASAG